MDNSISVAVITTSGTLLLASLTFYFTKRNQLKVEWQHDKINHYKVLLSSLSDLATDGKDKDDANNRFTLAVNTITLVAPQKVISALMSFHDEIKWNNQNKSRERQDECLNKLLIEIRKDIGFAGRDNIKTFNFHLIGSAPQNQLKK